MFVNTPSLSVTYCHKIDVILIAQDIDRLCPDLSERMFPLSV